ncbi:MAG: flagellar hook-length control protein FliK [Oscillospiraceae bacterium]|nr:flagellar hook-length control protein FliK [Oscillospiraceae bacterium]
MTVSMSMGSTGNYRADFMISDAALPQRVEQADLQENHFMRILNEVGGAEEITRVETAETVETSDYVDFSQLDDLELAMAVVSGKVDIKDVPAERITPRFLLMLAVAKRLAKRDKDDEDEKFENLGEKMKSNVFNPAEAANAQEQLAQLIDSMEMDILLILNRIRAGETEKTEAVGAISELMESLSNGLPIAADLEQSTYDEGFIAEIIDRMVETASEGQEQAEQSVNADLFVPSESAKTAVVEETFSAETQTILEKAVKDGSLEQPRVVESAERNEVKTATAQAVKPNANAAESQQLDDRAKKLVEELEMLRNAKAVKSAPKEFEIEAPKDEAKPVQAANPLMTDSPVVFTREDGSEISVKPSEVVRQAMEVVTKAVSENKADTEYSITLNPEELGKITVKLTKAADGAVSVTIAAENANTQRILERNSELMQSNLRSNGIQLESWQTVSESQQETTAQDYNGSSKNPYYREDDPQAEGNSEDKSFAEIIAAM